MAKKNQTPPKSFEEALAELEAILSGDRGGPNRSGRELVRYERGTFLIQHCRGVLASAEKQVEFAEQNPCRRAADRAHARKWRIAMNSAQQLLQTAWQTPASRPFWTRRRRLIDKPFRLILAMPRPQFMLGVIAHRNGQIDLAIDWLNKSAAADPKFAELPFKLASFTIKQGQLDAAMVHLSPGAFAGA